ncbi:MAG TPA: rod shape-determining protein MreC [Acidimicrobiales bacterium]|nr:rod shape-determining protein MreC [Acidimicrobiales bacterium]
MAANRRTSQRLTLVMLLLASLTVLTLDYHGQASHAISHVRNAVRDAISPIQRGVAAVLHPVGDVFSGTIHYGSLETQNQQLREALGQIRLKLAGDAYASAEAERVLALAHLPFVAGIPLIAAEVIGNSMSNFQSTIELGSGTSSGVGPGMPVVGNAGLVGSVISASSSTATVLLVTDRSSSIPVSVGMTGLYRALGAGYGRPLTLEYIAGSTNPHRGELVYTSGLGGGAIPAGIPVGVVRSLRVSSEGSPTAVTVTPIVNLDDLQFVAVLEWLEPG